MRGVITGPADEGETLFAPSAPPRGGPGLAPDPRIAGRAVAPRDRDLGEPLREDVRDVVFLRCELVELSRDGGVVPVHGAQCINIRA